MTTLTPFDSVHSVMPTSARTLVLVTVPGRRRRAEERGFAVAVSRVRCHRLAGRGLDRGRQLRLVRHRDAGLLRRADHDDAVAFRHPLAREAVHFGQRNARQQPARQSRLHCRGPGNGSACVKLRTYSSASWPGLAACPSRPAPARSPRRSDCLLALEFGRREAEPRHALRFREQQSPAPGRSLPSLAIAISVDASADFTNRPRLVPAFRNGASGFCASLGEPRATASSRTGARRSAGGRRRRWSDRGTPSCCRRETCVIGASGSVATAYSVPGCFGTSKHGRGRGLAARGNGRKVLLDQRLASPPCRSRRRRRRPSGPGGTSPCRTASAGRA